MQISVGISIPGSAEEQGFNPGQVGSGSIRGWWHADRGTTIATGVSQWNDLSGQANHLTQGTGSAQPTLVTSAYNGHSCVRATAASSQFLSKASTNLFGAGAYTIIAAVRMRASSGANGIFGNSASGSGLCLFNDAGPVRSILHLGVASMTDAAQQTATLEIWTVQRAAGAQPTLRINGTSQGLAAGSSTLIDPGGAAAVIFGAEWNGVATAFSDVDATEITCWNSALSNAEASMVEKYMGAEFNLVVA